MNIFASDQDPIIAARNLDNKRIIKMILESAQILSTAVHTYNPTYHEETKLYKVSHLNHPCTKWVIESSDNYLWLHDHYMELMEVYQASYGRIHASYALAEHLRYGRNFLPEKPRSDFANCASNLSLGITFSHYTNTVQAYRSYLVERWKRDKRVVQFTGRKPPRWLYEMDLEGKINLQLS